MPVPPILLPAPALLLAGTLLATPPPPSPSPERISAELAEQIAAAEPQSRISALLLLPPFATDDPLPPRAAIAVRRRHAERAQSDLIRHLRTSSDQVEIVQRYWIKNAVHVRATPGVLAQLARRPDLCSIHHDGRAHLVEPRRAAPPADAGGVEWNISMVRADAAWDLGYTGEGIIIGHADTGVDPDHPALAGRHLGHWHDAISGRSNPYDDHGHGTHTLGTICGGDGRGPFSDDIGVAPGARFVTTKVLDRNGSGSFSQIMDGLQFLANLKPSVDLRAVSNSWASLDQTDTFFWEIFETYNAIGILPIVANGNTGPNSGTALTPGNYSVVLGVGATNSQDRIASFSSRGPAPNRHPWTDPTTWYRDDWNLIKPDLSAPGEAVRSALPNGRYDAWSGTSMATPHLAGAVAILCQRNPLLTPRILYSLLLDHGVQPSHGAPFPNHDFGWGRLDVFGTLAATPGPDQPWLVITELSIDDPFPLGDGDHLLEPGEIGQMTAVLRNIGGQAAYDATVSVVSRDNFMRIENPTTELGDLEPGDQRDNAADPFSLHIHDLTPQGHASELEIRILAAGDSLGFADTLSRVLTIGTPPPPVVLAADAFDYPSQPEFHANWDAGPSWDLDPDQYHSPAQSVSTEGTSYDFLYLTMKHGVDISAYPEAALELMHQWDFDDSVFTFAQIDIADGAGPWWGLWNYSFVDEEERQLWTALRLPLADFLGEQVRLRFGKQASPFFTDFADWWIDDIEINSPDDVEPPYFHERGLFGTVPGPYSARACITDRNGVASASVYYRVAGGAWRRVEMSPIGEDGFQGAIPAQPDAKAIDYFFSAEDRWVEPSSGADPVGAPGDGFHTFYPVRTHLHELPSPR